MLWPDHPRQSAQQVLQTTLHGLRTGLGDAVEVCDGDPARAVRRSTAALAEAEGLGNQHVEAQIHLWLAPLLPADDARAHLAARAIAAQGARRLMLDDIMRLEATLALR